VLKEAECLTSGLEGNNRGEWGFGKCSLSKAMLHLPLSSGSDCGMSKGSLICQVRSVRVEMNYDCPGSAEVSVPLTVDAHQCYRRLSLTLPVRYDRGRRWVAAESSLGYSSEVSYCAALSDTVANVAHDEERMKERGRKGGKGKGNWGYISGLL
jgi:hypothetical protein